MLQYIFLSLVFHPSLSQGGLLTLYIPLSADLSPTFVDQSGLHLSAYPISRIPIPLWVAAPKMALFRGPILINAARTLVEGI